MLEEIRRLTVDLGRPNPRAAAVKLPASTTLAKTRALPRHTFSFGDYFDLRHRGFRSLRVINDDRVSGGAGFPSHPHRDMEIVSYVVEGALEHRDSLGTGSVIRAGEVQRMTAGTGVVHGEYNPDPEAPVRFHQIWIQPESSGLEPGYEQKSFPEGERRGRLRLVASRDGQQGSLTIHQDAAIYAATLSPGARASHTLAPGRSGWVQVVRGSVRLGDVTLGEGDGAAVTDEHLLEMEGVDEAELLLFDLN